MERTYTNGNDCIEFCMDEFSAVRHEALQKGVKMTGIYCCTYMDIARDAFLKYYQDSFMELKNVILMDKLSIDNEIPQEVRTVVKKESDHLEFIISSKAGPGVDCMETCWIRHAQGLICKVKEDRALEYTLEEIKNRCNKEKKAVAINLCGEIRNTNDEMNSTACIYMGNCEALVKFEFPYQAFKQLKGSILHPCMMDYIIDISIRSMAQEGWVPLSYGSLKLYGDIAPESYVYIREKDGVCAKDDSVREVNYDITIFDQSINIIAKIEEYKVVYGESAGTITNPDVRNQYSKLGNIVSYDDFNPYAGYQGTKHGTDVEDISSDNNACLYTSNLSWRQMDCRDRMVAQLLGHKDDQFANYFKFFLGGKRGYHLKEYGLTESDNLIEEILYARILGRFGYLIDIIEIDNIEDIHTIISEQIGKKDPVAVWFDEYYIHYSPFYLSSHTGHVTVINGCNSYKRVYSILDHIHLKVNNNSQLVNYGRFYSTYQMLENIYSNLEKKYRFIMKLVETVSEVPRSRNKQIEDLHQQMKDILNHIIDSQQAGRDTDTIYNCISEKGGCFDVSSVDSLYYQLGGKELLIDTIFNYFSSGYENSALIKELSYKIVYDSNKLVNKYVASMYRGKEISIDKISDCIQTIQKDTALLFKEVLMHL